MVNSWGGLTNITRCQQAEGLEIILFNAFLSGILRKTCRLALNVTRVTGIESKAVID